ncbi:MAG: SRPBCC family protein [Chloroflexota bacterium]
MEDSLTRVVKWVDIAAPRQEVFEIVTDLCKRSQLCPLWSVLTFGAISDNYPQEGSQYQLVLREEQKPPLTSIVTALVPLRKFAYKLLVDRKTQVTWIFQDTTQGTRIVYSEEYLPKESDNDQFLQELHTIIQQWLNNIKRYAELRKSRSQRLVRWLADHFYLNLRADQRRTVQIILFLHGVSIITFIMAAIALGFASLI